MATKTLSEKLDLLLGMVESMDQRIAALEHGGDEAPRRTKATKVASRLEAIEASRTEVCRSCKRSFSPNGLKAHNENRKHVSKPCSQWTHKAR